MLADKRTTHSHRCLCWIFNTKKNQKFRNKTRKPYLLVRYPVTWTIQLCRILRIQGMLKSDNVSSTPLLSLLVHFWIWLRFNHAAEISFWLMILRNDWTKNQLGQNWPFNQSFDCVWSDPSHVVTNTSVIHFPIYEHVAQNWPILYYHIIWSICSVTGWKSKKLHNFALD